MNSIEQKFYDAMLIVVRQDRHDEDYCEGMDVMDYLAVIDPGEIACIETVSYQRPIGIYIVDFLFEGTSGHKYVVEIDGHDAHKTKEQRFKDYRRERFLQEEGYTVFRFMASEVYVNAVACVRWVFNTISEMETKHDEEVQASFQAGLKIGRKNVS